jgi:periplasmic protein TonB
VRLVRDPGHGFGRAARACALARSYAPALDTGGKPIASRLKVEVRFVR